MKSITDEQKPTVAIITNLLCEKLAVDSLMERNTTYVRYKTEGMHLVVMSNTLAFDWHCIFLSMRCVRNNRLQCTSGDFANSFEFICFQSGLIYTKHSGRLIEQI